MAPELEIIDGEEVVIVHDEREMSRSFGTHFTLFVIKVAHLFVKGKSTLLDGFHIHHIVPVPANGLYVSHERLDLFIA